ncbi:VagD, partial [Salmonella enterica subsp. enterica serovar Bareilly str. CFSAN000220]
EQAVLRGHRIVVSAITYSEMRFGATGPKASPRHVQLVDAFCARLDAVLPWEQNPELWQKYIPKGAQKKDSSGM